MVKKKKSAVLLALIMVVIVLFCSCGEDGGGPSSSLAPPESSEISSPASSDPGEPGQSEEAALIIYPDDDVPGYWDLEEVSQLTGLFDGPDPDELEAIRFTVNCDDVTVSLETGLWNNDLNALCFVTELWTDTLNAGDACELPCLLSEGAPGMRLVARCGDRIAIWYLQDVETDGVITVPLAVWEPQPIALENGIVSIAEGYAASVYLEDMEKATDESELFWRAVTYALTKDDVYDYESELTAADSWTMYPWIVNAYARAILPDENEWPEEYEDIISYSDDTFVYTMWPNYYFNWIALNVWDVQKNPDGTWSVFVQTGDCVDPINDRNYEVILEPNSFFDSDALFDYHVGGCNPLTADNA